MRRRDKYANLVWLKSLETDSPAGMPRPTTYCEGGIFGNMEVLAHDLHNDVEITTEWPMWVVRIYPRRTQLGDMKIPCALSYKGTSLGNILSHAAAEALVLFSRSVGTTLSRQEVVRWVAP